MRTHRGTACCAPALAVCILIETLQYGKYDGERRRTYTVRREEGSGLALLTGNFTFYIHVQRVIFFLKVHVILFKFIIFPGQAGG